MERQEVLQYLCWYDRRNPNHQCDDEEFSGHKKDVERDGECFCDNCFYGRTVLANELIKYLK